ncbi:hypothetical protein AwDysgo_20820 [Bacteroidales bacterium]|nr:hypothetical protein AwDysgo_20820 [Bacteroidales bacterium]
MNQALSKLDTAKTVAEIQESKVLFERISHIKSSEWIPIYYIAYCNINSVYNDSKSKRNQAFLEEAKKYIDKLKKNKKANLSEIYTLEAYYYMAIISMDPEANGQKYFSNVVSSYEKAMELDPNNPRPICLLAFFEQQLPPFLRSKRNTTEELEKARSLFEQETKNISAPYWGEMYLNYIKTDKGEKEIQ